VPAALANLLRSLRSRNYRLFFAGQLISLTGTWLTQVATSWLVYRLTHSTVMLGVVSFAGQIPAFALSPVAGVLVDRWNLHRTLIATQTLAMLQSFALAILTLTHTIHISHILALYVLQGLINAVDIPARQAFLVQMVENRDDLANAIALNSSMFNAARLIGPSLAGVIIAATNEGICFLADGISYFFVILALFAMRLIRTPRTTEKHNHVLHDLKDGLKYAIDFPPIRVSLTLVAIMSLVGAPYTVLMPVFATDILRGGPATLGFLTAASGTGALAGGILLASRKTIVGLGKWIAAASVGFGAGLIGFAFSRTLVLSMPMMFITGFCMITSMASINTIIQTIVEDRMRGRIMSLFTMCFMGMMPFGALIAGLLARPTRLGPTYTLTLGGVACIASGAIFLLKLPTLRHAVRPVLVAKGILPQVATALESASTVRAPE